MVAISSQYSFGAGKAVQISQAVIVKAGKHFSNIKLSNL